MLGVCTWVVVRLCYKLLTVTGKIRRWFRSAQWTGQPTGRYLGTRLSLSCHTPPAPPALESHNAISYHHRHGNHKTQFHITTGTGITQRNFILPPALESHKAISYYHRHWNHTTQFHITTGTGITQSNFVLPPALESHNAISYYHRHWNHTTQFHITTGTGITQCNFISP